MNCSQSHCHSVLPIPAGQVHVSGAVDVASWWQRPPHEWQPGERLLACAAAAVAELRQAVHEELGYTTSAGIAHTKLMAKLCSGCVVPGMRARGDHQGGSSRGAADQSVALLCGNPARVYPTRSHLRPPPAACTSLRSRRCCRQRWCPSCWARCPCPSCEAWAASSESRYISRCLGEQRNNSKGLPSRTAAVVHQPVAIPHLQVCSELGIATVGELAAVPLPRLESCFGEKDAQWLYALARGVTGSWVDGQVRMALSGPASMCSSITCCFALLLQTTRCKSGRCPRA